jgi:hypothetical protein
MRYEDLWTECWRCGRPLDLTAAEVKSVVMETGVPIEGMDSTHALFSSNCPRCRRKGEPGNVSFRLARAVAPRKELDSVVFH